jgi:nucleotide-binding universal stress UspA family protein
MSANWFTGKCVVVPYDFSPESSDAIKTAVQLTGSGDDVHVVHILSEVITAEPMVIWNDDLEVQRRAHTRKAMEEKLSELGITNLHLDVATGNAGHMIADLAKKIGADLIVIPSHGRTGLKRLLIGSVAETVVRLSPCPVLVLKPA